MSEQELLTAILAVLVVDYLSRSVTFAKVRHNFPFEVKRLTRKGLQWLIRLFSKR